MSTNKNLKSQNVYQKIQKVRAELVKLNLKMTGLNKYSNFKYYELGDFLPQLNKLMDENGLMTRFVIHPPKKDQEEKALLQVFNSSDPKEVVNFFSETAEVKIGAKADGSGGAEPIQNLGGKITYMRRYMLIVAFEIVESDYVDQGKKAKVNKNNLELNQVCINKINKCKNLDELAKVCKDIKKLKGPKYQVSLVNYYTKKKGELTKWKFTTLNKVLTSGWGLG